MCACSLLTGRFLAGGDVFVPVLQPVHELLGVALVALLADDLLQTLWLVLVHPHQRHTAIIILHALTGALLG